MPEAGLAGLLSWQSATATTRCHWQALCHCHGRSHCHSQPLHSLVPASLSVPRLAWPSRTPTQPHTLTQPVASPHPPPVATAAFSLCAVHKHSQQHKRRRQPHFSALSFFLFLGGAVTLRVRPNQNVVGNQSNEEKRHGYQKTNFYDLASGATPPIKVSKALATPRVRQSLSKAEVTARAVPSVSARRAVNVKRLRAAQEKTGISLGVRQSSLN